MSVDSRTILKIAVITGGLAVAILPASAQIVGPATTGISTVNGNGPWCPLAGCTYSGPINITGLLNFNISGVPQGYLTIPSVPANEAIDVIATAGSGYHDNLFMWRNGSSSGGTKVASLNGTRGVVSGGSGYNGSVAAVFYAVALTGGSGTGATANFVINSSGAVIVCDIVNGGSNYVVGDSLSVSNTNLGNSGSGFATTVATINGTVGNAAVSIEDANPGLMYGRVAFGFNAAANAQFYSGFPMAYVEIGNCCAPANDTYDADFAVANTHGATANNLPGTAWRNFIVSGKTGDISFNNSSAATKLYWKQSTGNLSVGSGTASANPLGVFGGAVIGSGIAGATTALTNGLTVQGTILGFGLTSSLPGLNTGLLVGSLAGSQAVATTGTAEIGTFRDDYATNFNNAALIQHASADTGTTAGFANAGLQQLQFINVGTAGVVLLNTNGTADFVLAPSNVEQFRVKNGGGLAINGVAAVSCAANTVNLTTFTVTNGIVTHC